MISENCIHGKVTSSSYRIDGTHDNVGDHNGEGISQITSNIERCDIILTNKEVYNSKKTHEKISEVVKKNESIQTLNMAEINDAHLTVDRSNQIDMQRELVVKKVSENINVKNTATFNKTNETYETEENDAKRDATNRKSSKQRLSLTPMLSIDTYETGYLNQDEQAKVPIYESTVSESNIFKELVQTLSRGGNHCDPLLKVDNNKYFECIVLDKAGNVLQPLSNNSYQYKGRITEKNDSDSINPAKVYVNQKYQKLKHAALNDIIYETQNYDALQAMGVNDFNFIWNPNQSRFIELQNTVVTLQGNDYENDQKDSQKSSSVKVIGSRIKSKDKDSFAINTMKSIKSSTNHKFRGKNVHRSENSKLNRHVSDMIITNRSKNDSKCDYAANRLFSNKLSKWVSQNARVTQFDKYLQKEIYPLVTELNDIRNKCISYGLFTRDMVPYLAYNTFKSLPSVQRDNMMIGNQTFPKFEKGIIKNQMTKYSYETSLDPQNKKTEFQIRKQPNRMVYSILFDD
ncbi:uncharacterized protein LOC113227075 [Hyposmocoma kahamanoa]|uniref:uncharacterized protein LOC113227075 n=1 Tax=Hyposmocoma kahamanoa TaxID=1477025 RepID=UPI000E6DA429|nr:uncharacterized protein LOC113227075 [Hyposmocoma kahamanoa]